MTRRARRRRDRVTVDELLRQTGARPRRPGSRAAELAAQRGTEPEIGPSGAARIALASAVIAVLGGLVLVLALRPDPVPGSTQFPQLQPATGVPLPSLRFAQYTVVMHARKTPTPTPTVTVELPPPPPVTTKPSPPPPYGWDPRWNPYQCQYPYYCGVPQR